MSVINVLDAQTANLIAAGEVVDRPASVVKELLENAIDSGATKITAEIKNGGNSYIRITDDGCGMSREDAALCVKRHATSKLKNPEDLDSIATLGFRGEALAAISSVSTFAVITKRREDEIGTKFEIEGDEILYYDDFGCPDGTTVTVTDLFKNQPARQKFLKRDATEAAAVLQYVQRIAVSHPEIAFSFLSNSEMKLQTTGDGVLKNAIYCVYGKEFASSLAPVESESEQGVRVHGFVTRPDASRANRSCQSFYINRRYVKSKTMLYALEDAYKSYMKSDRFPGCVINLDIDYSKVDVNVHPAKLEVRFSDERTIYNAVYFAVKNALKDQKSPLVYESSAFESVEKFVKKEEVRNQQLDFPVAIPKIPPYEPKPQPFAPASDHKLPPPFASRKEAEEPKLSSSLTRETDTTKSEEEFFSNSGKSTEALHDVFRFQNEEKAPATDPTPLVPVEEKSAPLPDPAPSAAPDFVKNLPEDNPEEKAPFDENGKILGIAFEAFILYESKNELFFIDKHAAHERILYEKLKARHREEAIQLLIEPISVQLNSMEKSAVEANLAEFESIGFLAEAFGTQEYMLRGVPMIFSHLSSEDIAEIFEKTAEDLCAGGRIGAKKENAKDKILYSMACKAAVKAGIPDTMGDYRAIIEELIRIGNIVVCPHGRPIVTKITQKQLERLFLRN